MTLRQAPGFPGAFLIRDLEFVAGRATFGVMEGKDMPLTHFLGLLALVILAAALTVLLLVWMQAPLAAVAFAALAGSLVLGARQWR